jgi:Lrp/AsnC family leucine-responsive transcriptional regulator
MIELDKIDKKILAILQDNNQVTNLELAGRVGLSPPMCLRRVRRLRAEKVIEADIAVIDPKALGKQTTVIVEVVLDRARNDVVDAFKRKMLHQPEVSQCYLVTGEPDFILVVQISDMGEYEAFLQRTLYNDPAIKTMSSLVVVNRVKFKPRLDLS